MVSRNLSLPHRFICLTDDTEGLNPQIETFAIPPMPVDTSEGPERCWTKIITFSDSLYDIQGQCLFLDLDIVIIDQIDDLFTLEGEVIIIRDWNKKSIQRGTGNSSVYRFEIGRHGYVLQEFVDRWPDVRQEHRNEQEFISSVLLRKGVLSYWPEEWCRSFKRHSCHSFPQSLYKVPRIPEGAKILVFHGHPHPDEAVMGRSGFWYRFVRPTKWIMDYWR